MRKNLFLAGTGGKIKVTIKTKLTWNVIILIAIVAVVGATSIIGMGFIKSKLFYLTEQSTPFQMKTVEFQRSMQAVISELTKVSASKTEDEYRLNRTEAERSLSDVKKTQDELEFLSGSRIDTHNELSRIASELFESNEWMLKTKREAESANRTISQRLADASGRLNELDSKIKALQNNRSTAFMSSMDDTKAISLRLRNIESLKTVLKDIQISISDIQKAQDKRVLLIARGKITSAMNKALQNEYLNESKKLHGDIKTFSEKIEQLIKLQTSLIEQAGEDVRNQYDSLNKDIGERLSILLVQIDQDIMLASERSSTENEKQGVIFNQANTATNVLTSGSELVSLGLSVEGLSARLFNVYSLQEVSGIEGELRRVFEKIEPVVRNSEKLLAKINANDEIKMLRSAETALGSVRGLLFAQDGIISKIRERLKMEEKAIIARGRLADIILQQAEKGRETVTTARTDQEKAIGTVNRMVKYSMIFIGAIGIGSVLFGILFGTWVYKSIALPLNQLMNISDEIASGNLAQEISVNRNDEIGTVISSMTKMVSNLREIVGKIGIATSSLAGSSEELSATATSLQKGSGEQTIQIEQSVTAMTQMSQTTLDVAKNAHSTAESARSMKQTALNGKEAMAVTTAELKRFMNIVSDTAEKVDSLSSKSEEISSIVRLIKDIADQTNLLALNAAIEAAHAGEQGRGFAVVADNVRQLAERTTMATSDIADTVRTMQGRVQESVNFMNSGKASMNTVLEKVNDTMKAIDGIVSYVENVTDMVQRIAVATEQQSSTSDMVSHSMEGIATITRQLNSAITEIKGSSDALSKLAIELNSTASWFKV